MASGIAQPFVTLTPSGGAEFGIPQHEDALCDNAAELSRVAAAAVVAYFVYLNFSMCVEPALMRVVGFGAVLFQCDAVLAGGGTNPLGMDM